MGGLKIFSNLAFFDGFFQIFLIVWNNYNGPETKGRSSICHDSFLPPTKNSNPGPLAGKPNLITKLPKGGFENRD